MRAFLLSVFGILCLLNPHPAFSAALPEVRNGDVIFQPSQSFQSKAIEIATGSHYTHCGIVYLKGGKPYVFEAIRTVQSTPLDQWLKRGTGGQYVLMRPQTALSDEQERALRKAALPFRDKGYDLLFNWSDEAIYCSELIWKLYDRALGVQLTPLKTFRDYKLDHAEVQRQVKERFKVDIPWDEPVIAPSDLMESSYLRVVSSSGK